MSHDRYTMCPAPILQSQKWSGGISAFRRGGLMSWHRRRRLSSRVIGFGHLLLFVRSRAQASSRYAAAFRFSPSLVATAISISGSAMMTSSLGAYLQFPPPSPDFLSADEQHVSEPCLQPGIA